jgi:EAL domain-containing protein (putative c-di-GMP-specific phosphodiesterase class I)
MAWQDHHHAKNHSGIAHSLKLAVVAEGVETEEQGFLLRQEGCTTIQGYLASRPIPADHMTALRHASNQDADGKALPRAA